MIHTEIAVALLSLFFIQIFKADQTTYGYSPVESIYCEAASGGDEFAQIAFLQLYSVAVKSR